MLIESISFIASLLTCGHVVIQFFGETFICLKMFDNELASLLQSTHNINFTRLLWGKNTSGLMSTGVLIHRYFKCYL